jgi:hypothetical protein
VDEFVIHKRLKNEVAIPSFMLIIYVEVYSMEVCNKIHFD